MIEGLLFTAAMIYLINYLNQRQEQYRCDHCRLRNAHICKRCPR